MKAEIHPDYKSATIKCVCGNEVETGSTREGITVDICAKCHPFFTGMQKLVDTGGRVDRFKKRMAAAEAGDTVSAKPEKAAPKKATAKKATAKEETAE